MRKLIAVGWAVVALLAASFASPVVASAASPRATSGPGTSHPPAPRFPHALSRSSALAAPKAGIRSQVVSQVTCDGKFDVIASPNSTGNNYLGSTSAVSVNDVWAVGNYVAAGGFDRTLAEHWDGTSWSVVGTPNPGPRHDDLFSVSAFSSNDVWAVGAQETNSMFASSTIAEHWNGTTWTLVPPMNPSTYSYLFGVVAINPTNVLAVGTYYNFAADGGQGAYNTLIELWDGVSWAVEPSVNTGFGTGGTDSFNELFTASGLSASDIWAVGSYSLTFGGTLQPIAEHWNGASWSVVSNGGPLGGDNEMLGVSALEGGHALAVGYGGFVAGSSPRVSAYWNLVAGGGSFTGVTPTAPGSGDNALLGVARSGSGVWAVGYWRSTTLSARQTLAVAATWDSTAHTLTWGSVGTSASPSGTNNVFLGVTGISPYVFWATGYANNGTVDQTLTELYCALHFNVVGPGTATVGVPFGLSVTAKNADGSTTTGYRGTINFYSTDSLATLPAAYTFTPGDAGTHSFSGVVLRTPYKQTIGVRDSVTPFITGSAVINVVCVGVCQSPGGTPGSRGANQSPPHAPGPRMPRHLAVFAAPPAGTAHSANAPVSKKASTGIRASNTTRIGVQARPMQTTSRSASSPVGVRVLAMRGGGALLVSQRMAGSPTVSPWYPALLLILVLLLFPLARFRRRKGRERSNGNL